MGKSWEFLGKKLGKSWQKKTDKPCYYSIVRYDKIIHMLLQSKFGVKSNHLFKYSK